MKRSLLFIAIILSQVGFSLSASAQCGTTPIAGDLTVTADTLMSGTYNIAGTFTVMAGVTVTVENYSVNGCGEFVINADQIAIIGNIDADGAGFSGGSGGNGGTGGSNSGALSNCVDKDNCLVINTDAGLSGADGAGPGAGAAGNDGTSGQGPKQQCGNFGDEYGFVGGAGGAGGGAGASYGGNAQSAAIGGNGGAYNAANFSSIDIATCTTPQAGNGGNGGVVGASYGTATGTDIDLGSGGAGAGGGGKSTGNGISGNAGGNGGGMITLNSAGTLQVLGTVSASGDFGGTGGTGGAGGVSGDCCNDGCDDCGEKTFSSGAGGGAGAGGGSGGGILITANGLATISGTLRVEGGNGGTAGSGGTSPSGCTDGGSLFCGSNSGSATLGNPGDLGGGGSGGRIKIFQVPCLANNINPSLLIGGGNGFSGQAGDGTSNIADLTGITTPTITASADSISCFGSDDGVATVVVTGGSFPFTYSWSPAAGTDSIATDLSAGIYTVTVTDNIGCEATENVVISQPDSLTIAPFGILDTDCFGTNTGEASAMAFGGTTPYIYTWNDPLSQTGTTAQNLPAGTWTVTVVDAHGCSSDSAIVINQPSAFNATIGVDQQVSCFGGADGQATVTAAGGGFTFLWDDPAAQATATASGLTAGSYTVLVSSSSSCDTTLSITIIEPTELIPLAVENTPVDCNGASTGIALATATGGTPGYTFQWNDPNLQATAQATGLAAGQYEVIVTDANNCTATATVFITEPTIINISVDVDSAVCNSLPSGSIAATVSGGTEPYTYLWNDPLAQNTATATGLVAGSYSVEVTDANGCVGTFENALVQQPTAINVVLDPVNNISCNGLMDGSITATASGGTPGYTYQWDDALAQTGQTASGLSLGNYTVTATDANGCEFTTQITTLIQPDSLLVQADTTSSITCDGFEDAFAFVTASGGNSPYSYQWNDPDAQSTDLATGLGQGTYQVVVTDNKGCIDSLSVVIEGPDVSMIAGFSIDPTSGLQPLDINVTNLTIGGTQFTWLMGDGNEVFTQDTLPFSYSYQDSGSLEITLIAFNEITGCSDTVNYDSLYITPTSLLDIPTVFSPNLDGVNDIFLPNIRNVKDFSGTIYNRWGEKVYSWSRPQRGWDGRTVAGIELPAGTYYYIIKGVGIDADSETEYEFNGSVTLIR